MGLQGERAGEARQRGGAGWANVEAERGSRAIQGALGEPIQQAARERGGAQPPIHRDIRLAGRIDSGCAIGGNNHPAARRNLYREQPTEVECRRSNEATHQLCHRLHDGSLLHK